MTYSYQHYFVIILHMPNKADIAVCMKIFFTFRNKYCVSYMVLCMTEGYCALL